MQLVWILLIAAAITVIEILIYHYRLPRFFLFIFPLINICLEICIVFYILRQQALVTSYYPLWIRIGIYLLPLLLSLFIMTGFLVRRYVKLEYTKPFRHIVCRLFAFLLISMLFIFLTTIYFAQEYVIFYPNASPQDRDMLMADKAYERISIDSQYTGWLRKAENSGIFSYMKNSHFLSIDYPSYGDSKGSLSQEELFKMADAVLHYARHRYPNKKLYIVGYSIGTGMASYAASKSTPDALILLSPYNNGRDLFNSYFPVFYGPLQHLIRYPLTSDRYVGALTCPALVILSNQDTIVSPSLSRRLIECFTTPVKTIPFDTLDHGDIAMNKEVWKSIMRFLHELSE